MRMRVYVSEYQLTFASPVPISTHLLSLIAKTLHLCLKTISSSLFVVEEATIPRTDFFSLAGDERDIFLT
jgi:hypothetical protein